MGRTGRNAKKKLARKILQSYSAASYRKTGSDLHDRRQALSQTSIQFLDSCQRELDRRSALLQIRGCWDFLEEVREQATLLGVLPDLQGRVARAAARFVSNTDTVNRPSV